MSLAVSGLAQVPAGPPYQAGIHTNPIVSFVDKDDYRSTSYDQAAEEADLDLLGLSAAEGTRESIHISESFVEEVKLLGRNTDVLFFPVVRQTFRLIDGMTFVLYSFKDPRPTGIDSQILAAVLNEHAFRPNDKPEESRFGTAVGPERLEIRGSEALLFDETGEDAENIQNDAAEDEGELTLFWQDERASHVAVVGMSRQRLYRVVGDLF
jgi:hypothetical protein